MDILNEEFSKFLNCAELSSLRFMLIGGYAVNYYGYNRYTSDLGIWLAPTEKNKHLFVKTLHCMGYSESETESLLGEDFTKHFVGTISAGDSVIDVLTFVHKNLFYDEAEKNKEIIAITSEINAPLVPYEYLKEMKLLSHREKDLFDVARLEEIRQKK